MKHRNLLYTKPPSLGLNNGSKGSAREIGPFGDWRLSPKINHGEKTQEYMRSEAAICGTMLNPCYTMYYRPFESERLPECPGRRNTNFRDDCAGSDARDLDCASLHALITPVEYKYKKSLHWMKNEPTQASAPSPISLIILSSNNFE